MAKTGRISTHHGEIAYWDQPAKILETKAPVLFVHGNSSCKEMFDRQKTGAFADNRRLIALDLPGHGESENAPDPVATYAMDGFAEAGLELLQALEIEKAVLVGWSLGGHIVLEMAATWSGAEAVAIIGTPPIGGNPDDLAAAFLPSPHMDLTFKPEFSDTEAKAQAQAGIGEGELLELWMIEAARRAEGRFRPQLLESTMSGRGHDQKVLVASLAQPLAVLHGTQDPFINLAYLKQLTYRNLWRGSVQELDGLAHAPFWQDAERFNAMLSEFLDDVD